MAQQKAQERKVFKLLVATIGSAWFAAKRKIVNTSSSNLFLTCYEHIRLFGRIGYVMYGIVFNVYVYISFLDLAPKQVRVNAVK